MKKWNKDIPVEVLLKYIVKERDKYKAKLEKLIPYTKSLEKEREQNLKTIEGLRKRISGLSEEICKTDVVKKLQKKIAALRRDNEMLISKIASSHRGDKTK